jgi:putative ABC transport system permease protein
MRLTLVGLVVGVACALLLTRLISGLLYEVAPTDLTTLLSASGLLLLCEMVACYIPARRAMSVDPMVALRYE